MRRTLRRLLQGLLALPFIASLAACRARTEPPPTWANTNGGDELGRRVRAGEVSGVSHHVFHASALDQDVGLVVAVPPDYARQPEKRYPVIYMFPGIGGDEWSYLREVNGRGPALDALFADAAQAPIVVFGNPGSSGGYGPAERVLSQELVGFVDRTYRTLANASARSLEGFSLGGVTALTLFLRNPDVFGSAAAGSSACYLIPACRALRDELKAKARPGLADRVLLSIGARESEQNASVGDELAPLLGVSVVRIPGAEHDWGAQLRSKVDGRDFGAMLAEFHLRAFQRAARQ